MSIDLNQNAGAYVEGDVLVRVKTSSVQVWNLDVPQVYLMLVQTRK